MKLRDQAICDRFQLTRRQALALGGGGLAVLALAATARRANATATVESGENEVTIVSDGNLVLPLSFVGAGAPMDELKALLAANGLPTDALVPDCNVTFLKRGDQLIAFDTGSGSNFMPSAGKLLDNLGEAGIDPADVTDVVFTHAHPDHLWGMIDDFDEFVFSNAEYHIGEAEWAYWRADDTLDNMDEGRKTFVVGAQSRLALLEDRIKLFAPGAEVLPGVEAVDTSGHTPGHMSFMLHGGSEPFLVVGDAISNSVISFAHPEWPSGSDQDTQKGARTRSVLLDRLAGEKARIIGYHLPHPGEGRVERHAGAYRFAAG